MRYNCITQLNDHLKVMEVSKPNYGKHEVLIKVMASAVNSGDVRIRGLVVAPVLKIVMRLVLGFRKPRKAILGVALAGEIVAIGDAVTKFKVGDYQPLLTINFNQIY